MTTKTYSTSFSLGIYCLNRKFHERIYNIYGFVRFADEIVDSFHGYDQALLLQEFRSDTYKAIERGISLNPVLNSFQKVVRDCGIEKELIDGFLRSMETDLEKNRHDTASYQEYIYGSAEVVGLMCLRVFTEKDQKAYEALKPFAVKLGAAFQKVNFLRDLKSDFNVLERSYFPNVDLVNFSCEEKRKIEQEIDQDFNEALIGIRQLPAGARFGVYVAYIYYRSLFNKIKKTDPHRIMRERIRVSNYQKFQLLVTSYCRHALQMM